LTRASLCVVRRKHFGDRHQNRRARKSRRLARRREVGGGALGDYRRDGNRLQHDQTGRMNNLEDGLTSCEYRVFHEACGLASEGQSLAFSANSQRISAKSPTTSASFLTN